LPLAQTDPPHTLTTDARYHGLEVYDGEKHLMRRLRRIYCRRSSV